MTARYLKILPVLALMVPLAACFDEGPGERAGKGVDNTLNKIQDTVDPPKGPGEAIGRKIDRATN